MFAVSTYFRRFILEPLAYFSSFEIDNQGADNNNHSCHCTECGIFVRQHNPTQYCTENGIDQPAHIDIADFGSFALQGDKPEAEGEDRDKYENNVTGIESDWPSDESMITLRAQLYNIYK